MTDDVFFMKEALEEAKRSDMDVPVGAVVVLNGEIISRAHNERTRRSENALIAHAEILALKRASVFLNRIHLEECTLYVTLEPCPMCAGAILLSGVSRCCFGAYDPAYGCCGSVYDLLHDRHFSRKTGCTGGVLETECSLLLKTFFSGIRNPGNQSDSLR